MPDVFISYSSEDEQLARWLYQSCKNLKIDTFLASISLKPGVRWKQKILDNLEDSEWFFFLATKNSIKSDAVMHEIGAALSHKKEIISILNEINYKDLPEWIKEYQAIDIKNDYPKFEKTIKSIAKQKKVDRFFTRALIIALAYGFLRGERKLED